MGLLFFNDLPTAGDFFFVLVLGSIIGLADVFGRYQEAPLRTLATSGALVRIAANAAASLLALWFIKAHPLTTEPQITNSFVQVFAAGFGALALLRVSLKVRIADQDIAVGPAPLIDTILAAADRDASRSSAAATMRDAFSVQRRIGYSDILTRLAPLCVEVPQTLTDADRKTLLDQLKVCADRADCSERERGTMVLARLARTVGWDVIEAAAAEIESANSAVVVPDPELAALAREAE